MLCVLRRAGSIPLICVPSLDAVYFVLQGAASVLTKDFLLVGNNVALDRGYHVKFVHPSKMHKVVLWSGYISTVRPQVVMAGGMPVSCTFISCIVHPVSLICHDRWDVCFLYLHFMHCASSESNSCVQDLDAMF